MKAKKAIAYSFAGTALGATLLQTLSFLICYDSGTNYFQSKAILPIVSLALMLIAGALGIASVFVWQEEVDPSQIKKRFPFASAIPAIGFLAAGFYFLSQAKSKFDLICAIAILIASLSFVLDLFSKESKSTIFYLGFFAVFGCILLTGRHYFDMTIEMNAPIKVALQAALLFASVFFTQELRCLLSKATPRIYRAITAWTVALGCYASIPAIIAHLAGITDRFDYFCTALLVLSITVFAAIRLIVPHLKASK